MAEGKSAIVPSAQQPFGSAQQPFGSAILALHAALTHAFESFESGYLPEPIRQMIARFVLLHLSAGTQELPGTKAITAMAGVGRFLFVCDSPNQSMQVYDMTDRFSLVWTIGKGSDTDHPDRDTLRDPYCIAVFAGLVLVLDKFDGEGHIVILDTYCPVVHQWRFYRPTFKEMGILGIQAFSYPKDISTNEDAGVVCIAYNTTVQLFSVTVHGTDSKSHNAAGGRRLELAPFTFVNLHRNPYSFAIYFRSGENWPFAIYFQIDDQLSNIWKVPTRTNAPFHQVSPFSIRAGTVCMHHTQLIAPGTKRSGNSSIDLMIDFYDVVTGLRASSLNLGRCMLGDQMTQTMTVVDSIWLLCRIASNTVRILPLSTP